jgi:hypothetical protein
VLKKGKERLEGEVVEQEYNDRKEVDVKRQRRWTGVLVEAEGDREPRRFRSGRWGETGDNV